MLTGGDRGNRREYLKHALFFLGQRVGDILTYSAIYETEPWGFEDETLFLNQAILMETRLEPFDLLHETQDIERQLGRHRGKQQYKGRTLDIDILFFGDRIIRDSVLEVPHPRLTERLFALVPVAEICPDWIHPILKISVRTLLEQCHDKHEVRKWG